MDLIKGLSVAGTIAALPFHIAAYAVQKKLEPLTEKLESSLGKSSAAAALPVSAKKTEQAIGNASKAIIQQTMAKVQTKLPNFLASLNLGGVLQTVSDKVKTLVLALKNTFAPPKEQILYGPSQQKVAIDLVTAPAIQKAKIIDQSIKELTAQKESIGLELPNVLTSGKGADSAIAKLNDLEKKLTELSPITNTESNAIAKLKQEITNSKELFNIAGGDTPQVTKEISDAQDNKFKAALQSKQKEIDSYKQKIAELKNSPDNLALAKQSKALSDEIGKSMEKLKTLPHFTTKQKAQLDNLKSQLEDVKKEVSLHSEPLSDLKKMEKIGEDIGAIQSELKTLNEKQQNVKNAPNNNQKAAENKFLNESAHKLIDQLNEIQERLNQLPPSANGLQMELTLSLHFADTIKTLTLI